jgi:hypothetical protein
MASTQFIPCVPTPSTPPQANLISKKSMKRRKFRMSAERKTLKNGVSKTRKLKRYLRLA